LANAGDLQQYIASVPLTTEVSGYDMKQGQTEIRKYRIKTLERKWNRN